MPLSKIVSHKPKVGPRKLESGFTLVELLVGMLISLFIVGVTVTYMVSSSQAFKAQTNDDLTQENARFALEILSKNIRLAGFDPDDGGILGVRKKEVLFAAPECPDLGYGVTECTADSAGTNGSDRIALRHRIFSSEPGNPVGQQQTCNDVNVAENTDVVSIFWIAPSAPGGGLNSLFCQAYDVSASALLGDPAPILDGVDSMQVQYGVDFKEIPPGGSEPVYDGIVNSYQSYTSFADTVAANTTDVDGVRSIRIALLLSSGIGVGANNRSLQAEAERSYTVLDSAPILFDDAVARQIYSTTVLVPNGVADAQ